MKFISDNGKFVVSDKPVLHADNSSYRYGDGLFETMKIVNGEIRLQAYHFERLFTSLSHLKYVVPKLFTPTYLQEHILKLCKKNKCDAYGRVRLSVYRGNGGLYDEGKVFHFLIESWPLNMSMKQLNENGLVIDVFNGAAKSCDALSNLKSANFLPYVMAAIFAKEQKLNDCLILNSNGSIADATIANVFIVANKILYTPGLDQGCVNGVMRKHILTALSNTDFEVREVPLTIQDVMNADEVFLTNAMSGIRWVRQFKQKAYTNEVCKEIYNRFV